MAAVELGLTIDERRRSVRPVRPELDERAVEVTTPGEPALLDQPHCRLGIGPVTIDRLRGEVAEIVRIGRAMAIVPGQQLQRDQVTDPSDRSVEAVHELQPVCSHVR